MNLHHQAAVSITDFLFRGAFFQTNNFERLVTRHRLAPGAGGIFCLLAAPFGSKSAIQIGFNQAGGFRIVRSRLVIKRQNFRAVDLIERISCMRSFQHRAVHGAGFMVELHLYPV